MKSTGNVICLRISGQVLPEELLLRIWVVVNVVIAEIVVVTVAALAPTYEWFAVALVPCGLAALTAMTTANALVQLSVDPSVRGRVMALYMAIFMGGTPIGAPLIGRLGDWAGPRWTIGVGTIAVGLSVLVVGGWLVRRENGRVHARHQGDQVAQEPR